MLLWPHDPCCFLFCQVLTWLHCFYSVGSCISPTLQLNSNGVKLMFKRGHLMKNRFHIFLETPDVKIIVPRRWDIYPLTIPS